MIVLGTAGHRLWTHWDTTQASDAGDKFLAALTLADQGKRDEAEAALQALEQDGLRCLWHSRPLPCGVRFSPKRVTPRVPLPRSRRSATMPRSEAVRNTAKVRAAWLLVDTGSYEDVSAMVEAMATPTNAMRHAAREALGLAAYKAGDMTRAREWFEQIVEDAEAPRNVANRAQMLLDNIKASGKAL